MAGQGNPDGLNESRLSFDVRAQSGLFRVRTWWTPE